MTLTERLNVSPPEQLREYRPFEVQLQVTKTFSFLVDARTPEQAEDIAEDMANDGEEGTELSIAVDVLEVFPADSDATGFV